MFCDAVSDGGGIVVRYLLIPCVECGVVCLRHSRSFGCTGLVKVFREVFTLVNTDATGMQVRDEHAGPPVVSVEVQLEYSGSIPLTCLGSPCTVAV